MENFNIQRFGNVCSRLVMIRKKEYFRMFLGLMLVFTFFSVLACNPFKLEALSDETYKLAFLKISGLIGVISFIIVVLSGSMIISDLKTKQQRIDELALPATNLEKFVARVIGSTLLAVVILVVAFFVADLLQMLINMLLHKGTFASITVAVKDTIMKTRDFDITPFQHETAMATLISTLLSFLGANTTYVLGGMLFRKSAWLKTSLALILLAIIVFSLFVGYAYLVYKYTDYVVYIPEWVSNSWFSVTFNIVQIVVCYYFAYRIYCRLQAINTRWLNI
ncbi:hypothetical protein [Prevotella intermedia]|uniref:Uncharacterized protein n=2 Tax=Prevotella intermedia TaxID=28131 RepID=A0A2D3LHY6_PREIN|nr:hypothetical protein [Prevotella intermedia]ATV30235.1 hypothetical protein CTM46_01445 [Prevotella intermedia]PJI21964.1 hypothetical protein CTM45_00790 [Prevotella intermedia]